MSLTIFPPELLAQILNGKFSWAAIELWKTGDRILMGKLKNKGITQVSLSHTAPRIAVTWPRCLKEFQLQSLSLKCVNLPLPLAELRDLLLQQPADLESLSLDFPGATDLFLDPTAEAQTRYGPAKSSPTPVPGQPDPMRWFNDSDFDDYHYWHDLDEAMPSKRPTHSAASNAKLLDPFGCAMKMPQLHTLSLTGYLPTTVHANLTNATLIFMPLTVKHLSLGGPFILIHLPPSLQLESLSFINVRRIPDKRFYQPIYKTLQVLHATETFDWFFLLYLQGMLPNMKALYGYECPFNMGRCLPFARSLHLTSKALAEQLPDQLEKLRLDESLLASWPSSLVSLRHENMGNRLGPHNFHLLPRTLTELSIGYNTKLKSHKDAIRNYIRRVEGGALLGLPVGLTSLRFAAQELLDLKDLLLPPRLYSFELDRAVHLKEGVRSSSTLFLHIFGSSLWTSSTQNTPLIRATNDSRTCPSFKR